MRRFGARRALLKTPTVAAAGGGSATSWSTTDAEGSGAVFTYTNSNRTVERTSAGGSNYGGIRAVGGLSGSDKRYWEVRVDTFTGDNLLIGAADSTYNVLDYLNTDAHSTGDGANNFGPRLNTSYGAADVIGIAIDRAANLMWSRLNGGSWNPEIGGSQDPATAAGGYSISGMSGTVYPAVSIQTIGTKVTLLAASTDWTQAAPSGFTQVP